VVRVRFGSLLVLRTQLPGPQAPLVFQTAWRECGLGVPTPFQPHGTLLAVVGYWRTFRAYVASHALLGVVAVRGIKRHAARPRGGQAAIVRRYQLANSRMASTTG
jgi:hypothetical protein